jgi:hypothetical protein
MALIYEATVIPSKLELLTGWLPTRPWSGDGTGLAKVGSYRFDDPAGEVGLEGLLVLSEHGSVLHVPLTYRATPLAGADEHLIGTTEHSVLGTRWVYDACGDPVWATALATTVLTGGAQAEEQVDVGGRPMPRESSATVSGSGRPGTQVGVIDAVVCHDEGQTTVVRSDTLELVVVRVVGTEVMADQTLTGRWAEGGPAVLAGVRLLVSG